MFDYYITKGDSFVKEIFEKSYKGAEVQRHRGLNFELYDQRVY